MGFRPLVLPPPGVPATTAKRVYDILGTVVTMLLVNYTAMPFILLNLKDSLEGWRQFGWYGFWMVGSALVFFFAGGSQYLHRLQKQREKSAESVGRILGEKNEMSTTPAPPLVVPPLENAAAELLLKEQN